MPLEELSVVIPAYDESKRIPSTLRSIAERLDGLLRAYEIVVVDDGSRDGTADLVRGLGLGQVRVVVRPERGGKGAAVRTGVAAARMEWILIADADGAVSIDQLDRLAEHAGSHSIVIGSRGVPAGYSWSRRVLSLSSRIPVGLLAVRGYRDTQCGFKLFRASVARELFAHQRLDGYGYDFEVLYLARRFGHAVVEVPVHFEHQAGSKVGARSFVHALAELLALAGNRVLRRYPRRPHH